jgi:hypothetical protein
MWYNKFALAKREDPIKKEPSSCFTDNNNCQEDADSQEFPSQEYLFWKDYQRYVAVLERSAKLLSSD